jgi:hypothetical protein
MTQKPVTNKYVFTFNDFDHNKVITYTSTLKTKPIEEKRARELLVEELAKRGKARTFCYSVQRNGAFINLLKKGKS